MTRMRALLATVLAGSAIALLVSVPSQGRALDRISVHSAQDERIPGVLIVNFKTGALPIASKRGLGDRVTGIASVDALSVRYGLQRYRPLFPGARPVPAPSNKPDLRGYHVLEFDPAVDLDRAAADYQSDPQVASVEYDFYAYIMRTPDDPNFSQMWGLSQITDKDIDAPEAWDRTVGNPNTTLADTDTGVLYTHEDLASNIWVNPGEDLDSDGVVFDPDDMNGIDDDGNGYVDDLIGYDFVSGGSSVWPGEDGSIKDNDPKDFNGHGTHTSGTIAAVTNNGKGVAGVAGGFGPLSEPGCKLMCLRMGYSFNDGGFENGRTHMSYVAEAFRYAADNGAVGINYSFGSSTGGGIEAATDYAVAAGLVICAAAGNDNNSSFGYLQSRPDVICVASTTNQDRKSSFSTYGAAVDVSAPGSNILSTVSIHYFPDYAFYSGTSMATPHVVGLVGLIRSLNPVLTRQEVVDIIVNNADNIDALNPSYAGLLGSGRINAFASTQNIASANFIATPQTGNAPLTVQFTDSSLTTATSWEWDFGDGTTSTLQNPAHTYGPGLFGVTLRIQTAIGLGTKIKPNFVTSLADTALARDTSSLSGRAVAVEIWARNSQPVTEMTLPVIASNVMNKGFLDSIVTTGCRTAYFELDQVVFDNRFSGQLSVLLRANNGGGSPPLAPGSGVIAKVWLRTRVDDLVGDSINVSVGPLGSYSFQFTSPVASYTPSYTAGTLTVSAQTGDLNHDATIDVLDVTFLIDMVFQGGAPATPPGIADINCDSINDVLDLVALIDYVFQGGGMPTCGG